MLVRNGEALLAHAILYWMFSIRGGGLYKAVGFLGQDETMVKGTEMLRRTANECSAPIDQDHWMNIWTNRKDLPVQFRKYSLITEHNQRGRSEAVSFFSFNHAANDWIHGSAWIGGDFGAGNLVLRRHLTR